MLMRTFYKRLLFILLLLRELLVDHLPKLSQYKILSLLSFLLTEHRQGALLVRWVDLILFAYTHRLHATMPLEHG